MKYIIEAHEEWTSNACSCCEPTQWITYLAYNDEGEQVASSGDLVSLYLDLLEMNNIEVEFKE